MRNYFKKKSNAEPSMEEYIENIEMYESVVEWNKSEIIKNIEEYIEIGFKYDDKVYWIEKGGFSTSEKVYQKLFSKEKSEVRYVLMTMGINISDSVEFTNLEDLLNFNLGDSKLGDMLENLTVFV